MKQRVYREKGNREEKIERMKGEIESRETGRKPREREKGLSY